MGRALIFGLGSIAVVYAKELFSEMILLAKQWFSQGGIGLSALTLLGYRLAGKAQPGSSLLLTLYWKAIAPVDVDYTVFTHLGSADETMLGQMDHPPQHGVAPTSSWVPGEVLADHYEIPIRADAPLGTARLLVGMYASVTEDRLPASGPAGELDRILLTELEVETAP